MTEATAQQDAATVGIALYSELTDTQAQVRTVTWEQLDEALSEFQERQSKDGPLWSPVTFKDDKPKKRANENIATVTAFAFDYDHREPPWALLEGLQYRAHTTHTHHANDPKCARPDCTHWRVVVRIAAPIVAQDYAEAWQRLVFWLAPEADQSCKDESRGNYLPSCLPGAPHETRAGDGGAIDWKTLPKVPDEPTEQRESVHRGAATNGTGERPGDRFNREATWEEILGPTGARCVATLSDGSGRWCRPGKNDGHSATTDGGGKRVLYVFTDGWAPFDPRTSYTRFRAYSLLEHNGDDKAAAKALAVRYGINDRRSRNATARPEAEANPSGEPPPLGAAVLGDVHAFLGRFVAYPSPDAHVAHTLWVVHTHLMSAWESTPRIAFLSPEPGSGKTRALEVTELLVPRPVEAVNVTPAYLFRKVGDAAGLPTILYDEIDTVFGPKAKDNEEIRGLLNAGHRRGAVAGRCVVKGKLVETEEIPAYCAVALAGLGGLPDTILSRSVILRMRRRAPTERVEPFRRRVHEADGHAIRDRLKLWAASVMDAASDYWPEMPPGIVDRDADIWEPLLTVADLAGGEWPNRARCGAVALVADSKRNTPSLGVRLLTDLRTIFEGHDVLSTDAILSALNGLEEAPWGEIANGKPLNARGLSQRLRPYAVNSKTVRIGNTTPKGYAALDLADAWKRYVSPSPQESATSATNDAPPSGRGVADGVADETPVADESATNSPDPDVDLCATCGASPVAMVGLDCDECMGVDEGS